MYLRAQRHGHSTGLSCAPMVTREMACRVAIAVTRLVACKHSRSIRCLILSHSALRCWRSCGIDMMVLWWFSRRSVFTSPCSVIISTLQVFMMCFFYYKKLLLLETRYLTRIALNGIIRISIYLL